MQIIKDAQMSEYLWYKIGGIAKYVLICESRKDIQEAFKFIKKEKIKRYLVAGLGSNILFTDDFFDGAVVLIRSSQAHDSVTVSKDIVTAYAGATLDSVIQSSFEHGLIGLEWAGGLPGTVGAAVRGNVGAFGGEIKDVFYKAEVLVFEKGKISLKTLNKRDIKFAYRTSTIKKNPHVIVVSAQFKLTHVDQARVTRATTTYLANIAYRAQKHPLDYPSTGSAFKNISAEAEVGSILESFPDLADTIRIKWHGKVSMGYLIKRLDLSGLKVGGAQISNKHSNFIVNMGGASFSDVLKIIKTVQEASMEAFGFTPEPEVEIVQNS